VTLAAHKHFRALFDTRVDIRLHALVLFVRRHRSNGGFWIGRVAHGERASRFADDSFYGVESALRHEKSGSCGAGLTAVQECDAEGRRDCLVEVGVVFTALTLVTGTLWGRPTWGVWWTWDARLTSTALLLVLFLGYLALRRVPSDPEVRAKRCSVAALIAFIDVPIVHFSVVWWQTLHQGATVLNANLSPTIHGSMAWTLLLGFVAFTLLFAWMLALRYRVEVLSEHLQDSELDVALHERWAEGAGGTPAVTGPDEALAGTGRPA